MRRRPRRSRPRSCCRASAAMTRDDGDFAGVRWGTSDEMVASADDWRRSASRGGHAGAPAVHLGLDRDAQRRHRHPWQPAAESAGHASRLEARGRQRHRVVAAALPRHGARLRPARADLRRRAVLSHAAGGVHAEAAALAAGDLDVQGDAQRRAEFRVRPLRQEDQARRPAGPGSESLGGGRERRRADSHRDAEPVRRGVWRRRLSRHGVLPRIRTRRGDLEGDRHAARPGAGVPDGRRRRAGSRPRRRRASRASPAPGRWSPAG